jgi:hypothetical protein
MDRIEKLFEARIDRARAYISESPVDASLVRSRSEVKGGGPLSGPRNVFLLTDAGVVKVFGIANRVKASARGISQLGKLSAYGERGVKLRDAMDSFPDLLSPSSKLRSFVDTWARDGRVRLTKDGKEALKHYHREESYLLNRAKEDGVR